MIRGPWNLSQSYVMMKISPRHLPYRTVLFTVGSVLWKLILESVARLGFRFTASPGGGSLYFASFGRSLVLVARLRACDVLRMPKRERLMYWVGPVGGDGLLSPQEVAAPAPARSMALTELAGANMQEIHTFRTKDREICKYMATAHGPKKQNHSTCSCAVKRD